MTSLVHLITRRRWKIIKFNWLANFALQENFIILIQTVQRDREWVYAAETPTFIYFNISLIISVLFHGTRMMARIGELDEPKNGLGNFVKGTLTVAVPPRAVIRSWWTKLLSFLWVRFSVGLISISTSTIQGISLSTETHSPDSLRQSECSGGGWTIVWACLQSVPVWLMRH